MEYLRNFDTHSDYELVKSTLPLPNIAYCDDEENVVHYNPLEKVKTIVAKYNVKSTSSPTKIGYNNYTSTFSEIEIDGVVQPNVVSAYTFDTLGEHIVKYRLSNQTNIGQYAFAYCYDLASVIIPNTVAYISQGCFRDCSGMTSVTFPSSITSMGQYAFYNCRNLTSAVIPEGVTTIASSIFSNCSNLTKVTIPNAATSIGTYAFSNCENLTAIEIPNNVTKIDNYAFRKCSSLTTATIGNRVKTIGKAAFSGCSNMVSVTIGSGVTTMDECAFSGCTSLTSVAIPNSVTSIENSTFSDCYSLSALTIGSGLTSIPMNSFSNCSSLKSVTIPNRVTEIGVRAFSGCSDLTSLTIGSGVTSISGYAFANCSSLTELEIPRNMAAIEAGAFSDCENLISITTSAKTAPTISSNTFFRVHTSGTLTIPYDSSGYDLWLQNSQYYLGYYNWVHNIDGHEFVEINGIKWATMNIGANSVTDKGLFFQWADNQGWESSQVGSGSGKKEFTWNDYKYSNNDGSVITKYNSDGKMVLDPSDDAATVNWGTNWRTANTSDFINLKNATTQTWTDNYRSSGVAGIVCTDKNDSSKEVFFPAAGTCSNGTYIVGNSGAYWCNNRPSNENNAYYLRFYLDPALGTLGINWGDNNYRYCGYSVRAVID